MKAIVYTTYGPPEVLHLQEMEKPVPKEDEVLIRTHVTTVTSADWRARSLEMPAGFGPIGRLIFGLTRPRQPVLGTEAAGVVEAVGNAVTTFKVGDSVFAYRGAKLGCYAAYICMPAHGLIAQKPENLTFAQAAALCFGGTTVLDFFRRAKLHRGQQVLVNGASGGVGTAAVQIARYYGATVTGVCSTANVALVQSLGAHEVIDYTREDFTENGVSYDIIVDTVGTAPYSRSKKSLKKEGKLLLILGGLSDLLRVPWVALTSTRSIIAGAAAERPEDVYLMAKLAREGVYQPVIDRSYPFEQIVEAHRYVDTGRKRGNVVITLDTTETA